MTTQRRDVEKQATRQEAGPVCRSYRDRLLDIQPNTARRGYVLVDNDCDWSDSPLSTLSHELMEPISFAVNSLPSLFSDREL